MLLCPSTFAESQPTRSHRLVLASLPHARAALLAAEEEWQTVTHFLKSLATSLPVAFVVDDEAPLDANEELDATDFLVKTCSVSSSLLFRCSIVST